MSLRSAVLLQLASVQKRPPCHACLGVLDATDQKYDEALQRVANAKYILEYKFQFSQSKGTKHPRDTKKSHHGKCTTYLEHKIYKMLNIGESN